MEELVFSQYVLNRVFPSFHKSVPSALRRDLQDYSLYYSMYKCFYSNTLFYEFQRQFKRFHDYFSAHTFFGEVKYAEVPRDYRPVVHDLGRLLSETGERIERYIPRLNLEEAEKTAELREKFIFKLFRYVQPVDIGARAYKTRRNFGLSAAKEIL